MSSIAEDIRKKMMYVLKEEEDKTDLENLAVLSRIGMKVASAVSPELDADATSASSTALIDLGLRLNQATAHGALTEIILHNKSGYSILMAINDEYIVFGGLRNTYRIGYYLAYLRELARKLNKLISGDKETEMTLTLEDSELEKIEKQRFEEQEATTIKIPSIEEDKAALDNLLGFLDDWEKKDIDFEELEEDNVENIVSIPKSVGLGINKEVKQISEAPVSEDMGAIISETHPEFKIYDDEVPPVPLEDYTPMEIEEESLPQEPAPQKTELISPPGKLPSFEELKPPDFGEEYRASEYDTEFILEEESEALDSVLKDLGWREEEDK
jgi:predicted regulator of Ras-like GTPase activity (Roadblock/LC7/MglB family)